MAKDEGDVRPQSEWVGRLRTVCHECRGTGYTSGSDEDGSMRSRTVILPGDGQVLRAVGTAGGYDSMVTVPCAACGDSEDPGWLPGFVVPV